MLRLPEVFAWLPLVEEEEACWSAVLLLKEKLGGESGVSIDAIAVSKSSMPFSEEDAGGC